MTYLLLQRNPVGAIEATVDSCARETVMPAKALSAAIRTSFAASRCGDSYGLADGHCIPSVKRCKVRTVGCRREKHIAVQCADVRKQLLITAAVVHGGFGMRRGKTGGMLLHVDAGQELLVDLFKGLYCIKVCIKPSWDDGRGRHGTGFLQRPAS